MLGGGGATTSRSSSSATRSQGSSSPTCCSASSRRRTKGRSRNQGVAGVGGDAGPTGRTAGARRAPAARQGRRKTGGRQLALLANAYEALIAAIYLDGGIVQAQAFIVRELTPLLNDVREGGAVGKDYKSALQEYLQSRDRPLPEYRLAGTIGPDHRKAVQVEAVLDGEAVAQGGGRARKRRNRKRRGWRSSGSSRTRGRRAADSASADLDDAQSSALSMSVAPADAMTSAGSGCWGTRGSAWRHFARDIVFARRGRPAVQADPHAQERIGIAVALVPRAHEIDVLQPG